jgi:Protein of unknown function (DUF3313)
MPAPQTTTPVAAGFATFIVLVLGACASSSTPKSTAGVNDQLALAPGNHPGAFVYREPNLDPSHYKALVIDDTVVLSGAGTDFGKTSPQDQQRLALLLTTTLNDELRKRNYHLATGPGPGVARLHTSLIGITESKPAAATLLRLNPVGLGLTALKTAQDKPAAFTGSVTISGEITDSASGEVLAAFVATESPLALDLTSGLGTLRAAELGVQRGAHDFADALDREVRNK